LGAPVHGKSSALEAHPPFRSALRNGTSRRRISLGASVHGESSAAQRTQNVVRDRIIILRTTPEGLISDLTASLSFVYGFFTISTRLFWALPSSLLLSATGFSCPQPTNDILVLSTPLAIRASITAFARS